MELSILKEKAVALNDFYMYYRRVNPSGVTYMVATTEFDNSFILNRMLSQENPCGLPFAELRKLGKTPTVAKRLKLLAKLAKQADDKGAILVYSWSSDRFRVMQSIFVVKMTPLSAVLKNDSYCG